MNGLSEVVKEPFWGFWDLERPLEVLSQGMRFWEYLNILRSTRLLYLALYVNGHFSCHLEGPRLGDMKGAEKFPSACKLSHGLERQMILNMDFGSDLRELGG